MYYRSTPCLHLGSRFLLGGLCRNPCRGKNKKWLTFYNKKYVEEAERYSLPGSVAQKKAFFEPHYKRIAAQKLAALLEQENSVVEQKIPDAKVDNHKDVEKVESDKVQSV
ncbi:unnamed protein product [Fraxinus pennsylvanica]|uniref:Uncharacterized protein n=1 Tax=Fraxinus pennsylvanica TaxID=56036 RepID=A0AAD1ZBI2_9LAMI|nr:unnamed protein product [Fraxinus pennsylvanica]